MKPFVAFTAIFALITSPIQAQRTVHGVVFNDANGNGVLDSHERPLSGVVVSNQSDVVTTDAAGRYRLPADEKTIVFVSVPTDWQTVGSWWHTVAGSDSISFGLRADDSPDRSGSFTHRTRTSTRRTSTACGDSRPSPTRSAPR